MTPEKTIQALFDKFPHLFGNRVDCLDYLFCMPDNNFNWVNGELCHRNNSLRPVNELVDGHAEQRNDIGKKPFEDWQSEAPCPERWFFSCEAESLNLITEDDAGDKPVEPTTINLRKDSAYLWQFPNDITDEWWAAICEIMGLMLQDGVINATDIRENNDRYERLTNKDARTGKPKAGPITINTSVDPRTFNLTDHQATAVETLSEPQMAYAHACYQHYKDATLVINYCTKQLNHEDYAKLGAGIDNIQRIANVLAARRNPNIADIQLVATIVAEFLKTEK